MPYPLISEYIESIKSAEDNFEELSYLRPVLNDDGLPVMTSGNFAVVFKMMDERDGKLYAVKCFTKEQEGRAEAYKQITEELKDVESPYLISVRYLDKELFVDTKQTNETEFPVLLMDWVEGKTLDKYLRENLDDKYALEVLAYRFNKLARWLIPQSFAHGDLKPDNILVREDGTLVLVDYDGMYVPAMKGQKARELGSPDFRHPLRTEDEFDEIIDDFPIIIILFSLNLIAKDSSLLVKYGSRDRLLLSKQDYINIDNAELIQFLYSSDLNGFYEANLYLLDSILKSRCLKDFDLFWFRFLNKYLEAPPQVDIPKIKVSLNGAEFSMVYVEGDCVLIGGRNNTRMPSSILKTGDKSGKGDDDSICRVKINSFWISESLVTMDIWPCFLDNPNGIYPNKLWEKGVKGNNYAVYGMSYDNCKSFMRTLGKLTNVKFDFPTEIEWEYAARGGIYSNGYMFAGSDIIADVAIYGQAIEEKGIPSCRVKTKKPNELGIYDMSGGLYEWCKDNPDEQNNSVTPPKSHMIRGGCMNSDMQKCSVSYKSHYYEHDTSEPYGWLSDEPFWWQVGLRMIARNIDMSTASERCIVSISEYPTDEDTINSITDEFGAIYSKDGTKLISVPKGIVTYEVKQGVRVICHRAFCFSQIQNVVLPDSLILIGSQAFYGNKQLKKISIPSKVYRIGIQAFCDCRSLTEVVIPESVNYIESSAFSGCVSLTKFIIPNNVDFLEEGLFSGCETLEFVVLPEKLEIINKDSFGNCKRLKSISIPQHVIEICENPFRGSGVIEIGCVSPYFVFEEGFLMTADKTELIACLTKEKIVSVPPTVKTIRSYAFYGCISLEHIFLPEGLTEIMHSGISNCPVLSELIIPSSVKYIQSFFLSECKNCQKVIILSKDIQIDNNSTFYKADSLTQILIPKEIKESFNMKFAKFSNIVEEY